MPVPHAIASREMRTIENDLGPGLEQGLDEPHKHVGRHCADPRTKDQRPATRDGRPETATTPRTPAELYV